MITTFKPELIEGADKLFEIEFKNGKSAMTEIDKDHAFQLIGFNN